MFQEKKMAAQSRAQLAISEILQTAYDKPKIAFHTNRKIKITLEKNF